MSEATMAVIQEQPNGFLLNEKIPKDNPTGPWKNKTSQREGNSYPTFSTG